MGREPESSPFVSYLRSLGGPRVFFDPLAGNHGDRLIREGAEHVLARCGCVLCPSPEEADLAVVNGGGYFNPIWGGGLAPLSRLRRRAPGLPVVFAPQTVRLTDAMEGGLRRLCARGTGEVVLFLREPASLKRLRRRRLDDVIRLELSRDLAFELEGSDFLRQRRARCRKEHLLCAWRIDRESSFLALAALARLREAVPAGWRLFDRALRRAGILASRLLWRRRQAICLQRAGLCGDPPVVERDVALEGSFEDFLAAIEEARAVVTDRLHVAIYAHLLGKPAVLVPHPSYDKVVAVYRYGMAGEGSSTVLLSP